LFVEREGPLLENRQDIQFISEGLKCAGWFYQVPGLDQAPCIILAHGFCGVKELRLDAYAEAFVEAVITPWFSTTGISAQAKASRG
jgi:hypothetical protein